MFTIKAALITQSFTVFKKNVLNWQVCAHYILVFSCSLIQPFWLSPSDCNGNYMLKFYASGSLSVLIHCFDFIALNQCDAPQFENTLQLYYRFVCGNRCLYSMLYLNVMSHFYEPQYLWWTKHILNSASGSLGVPINCFYFGVFPQYDEPQYDYHLPL